MSVCWIAASCAGPDHARDLQFDWILTPAPVHVGSVRLELRVLDAGGRPVRGARLEIEAQMSHPGMAAVVATAAERSDGVYEAALDFSMAGDWILVVAGSLPNGTRIHHRIDVPNVRPA